MREPELCNCQHGTRHWDCRAPGTSNGRYVCNRLSAYETDLLEYGDIFDGSKVVDAKVAALIEEALAELKIIQDMGGAVAAIGLYEAQAG